MEQTGLTAWSFGELPRVVEIEGPGHTVKTYPALIDEGDSVGVRLLATPTEQAEAMWEGTRRLLLLHLPSPGRLLRPLLTGQTAAAVNGGPYGTPSAWAQDCLTCAVDQILAVEDESAHEAHFRDVAERVPETEPSKASEEAMDLVRASVASEFFKPEGFSVAEIKTPADALKKALELEKATLFFSQRKRHWYSGTSISR